MKQKNNFLASSLGGPESIIPVENKHDAVLCYPCHPARFVLGFANNFHAEIF